MQVSQHHPDSELRTRVQSALKFHSTGNKDFGKNIWDKLELVSVEVKDSDSEQGQSVKKGKLRKRDARVIVETVVQEDWLNPVGVLHGAATAYIVDVCSSLPLIALSTSDFWPGLGGLSSSMNLLYHAACPKGTRIRIDSSTLNTGKTIANMRCEIRDAVTSRLYASGTHTKVDAFATRELAKSKDAAAASGAGQGDLQTKARL